jgi:hypothetical protein
MSTINKKSQTRSDRGDGSMGSREKLKNPVFLFNSCVLGLFIILNQVANGYALEARRFPKFVFEIGIAVLLFWMIIYFFFPELMQRIEAEEEVEEGASWNPARFYRVLVCIAISILTGYLFGFIFLVPAAFLSYGLLLGNRKRMLSLLIIMVITTAVFYLGFDYVLNIPLLNGAILSR